MARNAAYYIDPEEERRRIALEVEEAFANHPSIGTAPAPRIPASAADMTTRRRTDGYYPPQTDAWAREEPTAEEAERDETIEREAAADFPRVAETDPRLGAPLRKELERPSLADQYLWADTLLEDAPKAVDKTSASVSAEQKGVPAEKLSLSTDVNAENGWADTLLQQVQKRVFDKPEATESALHKKAEGFASQALDPKPGFSREKQVAREGELYGEDSPPSTRWEDEFNERHGKNRLTDDQIRRRGAAIGFFTSLATGDMSQGAQWADAQHRANAGYEQGLEKARERDRRGTRISRGMAEAIAATGQMSPEAAAKLTYGDDAVRNFGQFASAGGRAEGQALGRERAQMDLAKSLWQSGTTDDRVRAMGMFQGLMQLGSAQIRAQMMEEMSPEQIAALKGSWMASHLRVPKEVGEAVVAGDTSRLSPEQKEKAEKLRPVIDAAASDSRVRGRVVGDQVKEAAGAETKEENAVHKSIALAQNDVKYANKWQGDWTAAQMPLKEAIKAWKTMSPEGKSAFSSWSANGAIVDQFAKAFQYAPGDQVKAAKVREAINSYVKANAGSAVTGSEWDRMATRVGIPTGTWAPFNDPEVVGSFLNDAANAMTQNRQDYERVMGGWK